jgi:threonine/homoserine/homoserine lactone efflux protein
MTPSFAGLFLLTVTVATITPGPSMLLALNHGIRFGARGSVPAALGNVCGTAIQCVISFAGLTLLLAQLGWALAAIRYLGAAYLVYLGLMALFADAARPLEGSAGAGRSRFGEAFFVTLGNPKAILFFSALFPQFIGSGSLSFARAAWMLTAVLTITFSSMMLYAAVGQRIQAATARIGVRRWINRTVGSLFIALGAGLAFDRK